MKKRKLSVIILACILALALCACGSGGSSSGGSGSSAPSPKEGGAITIGVLDHIIETGSGKTVKDYIEAVIVPNFPNVTFIYSENSNTVEQEKTAVENLIQQKVDGIISTDAMDFEGLLDTCASNDVYLVSCIHQPPTGDIEAAKEDLGDDFDYFLGFIGATTEEEYNAGAKAAEKAVEEVPNGTIATFGQPGYVQDSFEYQCLQGAWDVLEAAGRYDASNFFEVKWDDSVVMTLASNVMTINPAAVVATIAAPDLICGKVQTDKAEDTTQVYGVGFICNTYKTFMEKGSLDYIMCYYADQVGGAFTVLYNWLNNGVRWSSSEGDYTWINIPYIEVADAETMAEWTEYCLTADKSPFTFSDLQTVLIEYNPDATYEDAVKLFTAISLDEVKARRAANSSSGSESPAETTEAGGSASGGSAEGIEPLEGYESVAMVDFMGEDVPISYTIDEEALTWKLAYSFNGNDVEGAGTYTPGGDFEVTESNNDFLTVAMENSIWPVIGK